MSRADVLGGDFSDALAAINVPSYVIDKAGVIRWLNPAAEKLVGNVRGKPFTAVVAPEDRQRAREAFARKVAGTYRVTDVEVTVVGRDGQRIKVEISSVQLNEEQRVVGVFGQVTDVEVHEVAPVPLPALTPRLSEVLRHLEHGKSTAQIAEELQLSQETVKNHIRRLLRTLDCHTRLEAVARTRAA
jgi:PAS domain S-box-containing protein